MTSLNTALLFDETDLEANRQGHLTSRQRNHVYRWHRPLLVGLIFSTLLAGWLSIQGMIPVLRGEAESGLTVLLALVGEAITVALAFIVWSLYQRFKTLEQTAQVQQVSGPVTLYVLRERQDTAPESKTRAGFYVRINTLEFAVDETTLSGFEDGKTYILYYLSDPFRLLSAETITSETL